MPSLLGAAYLQLKDPQNAAAEYRRSSPIAAWTPIRRSRRLPVSDWPARCTCKSKIAESKAAYETLFRWWRDADKDLPPLVDARREYAALRLR